MEVYFRLGEFCRWSNKNTVRFARVVKSSWQSCKRSPETPASLAGRDTGPGGRRSVPQAVPGKALKCFWAQLCSRRAEMTLWKASVRAADGVWGSGAAGSMAMRILLAFLGHQRSGSARVRFVVLFIPVKGSPCSVSNGDRT